MSNSIKTDIFVEWKKTHKSNENKNLVRRKQLLFLIYFIYIYFFIVFEFFFIFCRRVQVKQ